ncbi:hypothetical protein CFOL_v3_35250 [Cephalotus follicularis]|uniref:Uncharacterized protein n=1 Tax=Cephalotus follicularis TaxID=3775 RepID=A0A1Q3DHH3_CEPFO|nr:hypothetical protein CFOL_v3_35250 [Cephalotus follicularis]
MHRFNSLLRFSLLMYLLSDHFMSSASVNESDRLGLKYYPKNCKCGNRKHAVVRIVESEKNMYKLYYSCENKKYGGFLGWCLPFFYLENISSLSSSMIQDNGVEEMGNIRGEIQTLREEHKS